jgi:crotonobetainyl-CoA:carnitine CoA-transferase CaiB-like acyl-CoA transferase
MVLADVTVVDLSLQLPGPYATMLLRGLGARVVKVEPPGGDVARELDPRMFGLLNAGKESLELDLRTERGREVLDRLASIGDVFLEGFRPGVADRIGAGYEHVSRLRPDVVYCSLSGYGQAGPYRDLPGHDLNYLGVAGGVPAGENGAAGPQAIGMPVVDLASGTMAALAVVSALRRRDRTGQGQYLDVAMLDSAVVWSNLKRAPAEDAGEPAYGVFRAADGRLLSLAVLEDKFWRSLCRVLGWEDWDADPALADHAGRKRRAGEIAARLATDLAARPRDDWIEAFDAADVPAAAVSAEEEVAAHPQVAERGLWSTKPSGLRAPLPPELAVSPERPAPARSQDAPDLLAELGFGEEERSELMGSGAVAPGGERVG